MIAKQRDRRHLRGKARERFGCIGILARGIAGANARQIRCPGDQPIDRANEPRFAFVASSRFDPRRERRDRELRRARQRGEPRAAFALHAGIGAFERRDRRATRLGEKRVIRLQFFHNRQT